MADADKNEQGAEAGNASTGGRFPFKTVVMLLAVMLIEGAIISTAFMLSGGPAEVSASAGAEKDEAMALEKPIELLVVADKFQNTRTGRTYMYDTEVYIVIKQRHKEQVSALLESQKAHIRQDIRTIISRAEPSQMLEPTLSTLTRQIRASLDEKLGREAQSDKPLIDHVLITKCTQFRLDM